MQEWIYKSSLPAVDGNGVVPRLALHLANLHDGVSDSLEVAAVAIGSPVDDVELCAVADLEGVPWIPWNPSFEDPPLFLLLTW